MIFTHFSINLAMSIKSNLSTYIISVKMAFEIKKNKCTLYLCASQVKLLNDFCYSYTPILFLGNFLHLGAYVYNALKKIPTNIFISFSSKLHIEHNQRGVGRQFLRPISQELCYIYLPIHIQYPSSRIRSMQIFIISPLKTTFMT